MGGCLLVDHKMERLSARQREKLQVAPVKVVATPYPQVGHTSSTLPSMHNPLPPSSTLDVLDGLYASNATSVFLEQQGRINEVKRVEEQRQLDLDVLEEADYQMAVAESLDLPYIVPATSSSSSLSTLVGTTTPSTLPTPTTIRTIPHNALNITQHMNKDWMRPVEDKTKMPRRLNWEGGGNCFTIIFWEQV